MAERPDLETISAGLEQHDRWQTCGHMYCRDARAIIDYALSLEREAGSRHTPHWVEPHGGQGYSCCGPHEDYYALLREHADILARLEQAERERDDARAG